MRMKEHAERSSDVPELSTAPQDDPKWVKLEYADGGKYEGHIDEQGRRHGPGLFIDRNGNVHDGSFHCNRREGHFTIKYSNGETFAGEFFNDKRHGEGTHFFKDGSKYHGEYEGDMRHGRGFYWTQHDYYMVQKLYYRKYETGSIKEEEEIFTGAQRIAERPGQGFGTYIDAAGNRYEGEMENYMRHGKVSKLVTDDGASVPSLTLRCARRAFSRRRRASSLSASSGRTRSTALGC